MKVNSEDMDGNLNMLFVANRFKLIDVI